MKICFLKSLVFQKNLFSEKLCFIENHYFYWSYYNTICQTAILNCLFYITFAIHMYTMCAVCTLWFNARQNFIHCTVVHFLIHSLAIKERKHEFSARSLEKSSYASLRSMYDVDCAATPPCSFWNEFLWNS